MLDLEEADMEMLASAIEKSGAGEGPTGALLGSPPRMSHRRITR